jgi:proteasome lid subunit RPN8/RPN11
MTVILLQDVQAQIFRHLESSYPNEGGGFLLGQRDGETVRVTEAIEIENVFEAGEQYHRYAMTPLDWSRLEDEADSRGLNLVGYFHSHPDSPAIPSDFDRDHALPQFLYLITPVYAAQAGEMLAWWLNDDRTKFNADSLSIA